MPQNAEHLPVTNGKAVLDSATICNHSIKPTELQSISITKSSFIQIARPRVKKLHGRFRLETTAELLHGKFKDDPVGNKIASGSS